MLIFLLAIITIFVVGIFLTLTAKQRAAAKARDKQRRAQEFAENPVGYMVGWILLLIGGLVAGVLMVNDVSFWNVMLYLGLPLSFLVMIIQASGPSPKSRKAQQSKSLPDMEAVTANDDTQRERVISDAIRAVYEAGISSLPKVRTPHEYLQEVRVRASRQTTPVYVGVTALQIMREDCTGNAQALMAIDQAHHKGITGDILWSASALNEIPTAQASTVNDVQPKHTDPRLKEFEERLSRARLQK